MFTGWLRDHLTAAGLSELSGEEIVARLGPENVEAFLALYEQELWDQKHRKFENLFPAKFKKIGDGEWSEYWPRSGYPRHMEFFKAGALYDERCFMAGNRVGKTVVGGFEVSCHLTGLYPDWWEGRRFERPIRAIAAGDTTETTRDIIQATLFGEVVFDGPRKTVDGSGIIPTHLIGRSPGQLAWKRAIDLIDSVKIKHASGGWSKLQLKSYEQGRKIFQGTSQHLIWVDEEPPLDVYDEARIRTMTTKGITMLTYTPLEGLTDTVLSFLPVEMRPAADEPLESGDWGKWNQEEPEAVDAE
jgi:phage terminase large subunit-like protein